MSDLLEPVEYGHKRALNDLDSYFDSLPTACKSPDCLAQQRRAHPAAHPRRPKLTHKQLVHYERTLLGYHRRAEAAITAKQMKSYDKEASKIVSSSDRGYQALEKGKRPQTGVEKEARGSRGGRRKEESEEGAEEGGEHEGSKRLEGDEGTEEERDDGTMGTHTHTHRFLVLFLKFHTSCIASRALMKAFLLQGGVTL